MRNNMKNGILWSGRSELNGEPIVVVATGIEKPSANRKTGDMVQVWILAADVAPHLAAKLGSDSAVCGDCAMRPSVTNTCYVQVHDAPLSVWRTYARGGYAVLGVDALHQRDVRLGAYGDPAAVPFDDWVELLRKARRTVGYTHQWRKCDQRLRGLCMASVETEADAMLAWSCGWRTFRARFLHEKVADNEIVCPATDEGGNKSSCVRCGLCNGQRGDDRRPSITLAVHGSAPKLLGYTRLRVLT